MNGGLRLLCWNVYNKRRSMEQAVALCRHLSPDVLCLQEVDARLLELLRHEAGWQVHSARDFIERGSLSYLVTATPWRSVGRTVPVNDEAAPSRSLVGRFSGWAESLDALHVRVPEADVTLVNLHLSCAAGPTDRLVELARALAATSSQRLVVCGDFNSFAEGPVKLLGPLFGFRRSDYRGREGERVTRALRDRGLQPLETRRPTAPFGLTLDRVAVGEGLQSGASIEVLPDRHGSDHHPLLVTLPAASLH